MRFGEASLQLVELRWSEARPVPFLFLLAGGLTGALLRLLLLLLLLLFLPVNRHAGRVGSYSGDVFSWQESGPFNRVGTRRHVSRMHMVWNSTTQPAF